MPALVPCYSKYLWVVMLASDLMKLSSVYKSEKKNCEKTTSTATTTTHHTHTPHIQKQNKTQNQNKTNKQT